jgi:hypothetical protein
MATKSGLIASINGFITAIITQVKLRNAFLDIINSLFQTTTLQEFTSGSNNWQYRLYYKKVGNIVYVNGFILNTFGIAKSATTMVTIPNSELYSKTDQDTVASVPLNTGTCVVISFSQSSIYLIGSIPSNQRIYINAHYQTND